MNRWLVFALALGGCAPAPSPAETPSSATVDMAPAPRAAPAEGGASTDAASCRMVVAVTGMT